MTKYRLTGQGYVIKDGVTRVPTTAAAGLPYHPETIMYLDWLRSAENIPEPFGGVSEVPVSVSRAQGKSVLVKAGLLLAIDNFLAAMPDPVERQLASVAFNDTQEWRRDSPFLTTAAKGLGITDDQLDDLFRQAAKVSL